MGIIHFDPTGSSSEDVHPSCSASWPGTFACLDLSGVTIPLGVILILLVAFAVTIEHLLHKAIHAASHDRFWRNFMAALISELSMLGIISFTLFLTSQLGNLTDDHVHLIEFVHLTLFLMMIFYYLVIAWMAVSSKRILKSLGDYEERVLNFDLVECIAELKQIRIERRARWCSWITLCSTDLDKRMHLNTYLLTRHYFLLSQGLPATLPFDYAEYVDRCTAALLVKLVQVGWRTWLGILTFAAMSIACSLIVDSVHGTDRHMTMEHMWSNTAAVNLNYFWAMFFLGWSLYLTNGLIWAGFERSRARLILLTAKKETMGCNVRPSSRWTYNENGDENGNGDDEDDSSIGNFLRSTISRDWSHGGRHEQQRTRREERKQNTDLLRETHKQSKLNSHGSNHKADANSQHSRPTGSLHSRPTGSQHSRMHSQHLHSQRSMHSQQSLLSQHDAHRPSIEKTVRKLRTSCMPCCLETNEWRMSFPLRAPEFPLRTFQGVVMFFSLFLAMSVLVFFHIDPMFCVFSIVQPVLYLRMFGLQQIPLYATLRYFGPGLAKGSLVDDLVYYAQELQYEAYRVASEEGGEGRKTEARSSATGRSSTTVLNVGGEGGGENSGRSTEVAGAPPGVGGEGLLRGWGAGGSTLAKMPVGERASRVSFRGPTIIEDEEELGGEMFREFGSMVAGEEDTPAVHFRHSFHPVSRVSGLGRDSHLEALLKSKKPGEAGGSLGENKDRKSLNVDLWHALRLSEARISSRASRVEGKGPLSEERGPLSEPLISGDLEGGSPGGRRKSADGGGGRGGGESRDEILGEYGSSEMQDEICELLNSTSSRQFTQIAIFRSTVLVCFFLLFLFTDCTVSPGRKLECTWLSLL